MASADRPAVTPVCTEEPCGDHCTAFTTSPVQCAANAHISAVSSMTLSGDLPAPRPARVSMRTRLASPRDVCALHRTPT